MKIEKSHRILVTGGTGFLGSYILRYLLKAGYNNLSSLCRSKSRFGLVENFKNQVNWIESDLLDYASLDDVFKEIDYVIHAAAIISLDPRMRAKMYKTNIEGTQNIVNLSLEHNIKKLIHVSSIAAIGRTKNDGIISESTEWQDNDQNSHYSITKFKAELELWRGASEGLSMAIVNPSLILGAGYWNNGTAGIVKRVQKGIPFYPIGSNGMCDVRDVAKSCMILLESDIESERFIISNQNMKYQEVFKLMAESLGCKYPTKPFTNFLSGLAWRAEWLRSKLTGSETLVTKESLLTTSLNSHYNNQKSIDHLNLDYRDMKDSIKEICQVYSESTTDFGILTID